MSLPFTLQQFLETFRIYNNSVGFAPVVLVAVAAGLVLLAHGTAPWRHRGIAIGLAALWVWAGVVYHLNFFVRINPAASLFGGIFLLQAVLFVAYAFRGAFRISAGLNGSALVGWLLVGYSLLVYPMLGSVQGRGYPDGPSFGAPCPIVIFSFGILCWTVGRVPRLLLVIPVLWAVIGTSAAIQLGIREDFGLAVGALLLLFEQRRSRSTQALAMERETATNGYPGRTAPST